MILNGITYHKESDINVINALDNAYQNKKRIRVWYGKNGVSWDEENDIIGYVGRSTGMVKIPLLVYNKRSFGGGGLLDNCIVKIVDVKNNHLLYQHPNFKQNIFTTNKTQVLDRKGDIYANCKSIESATRLCDFMNGKRNSK